MKRKPSLGRYGITGNSGLGVGGFFHVNAPFDCNGKVFVKWEYRQKSPDGKKIEKWESWKRMTLKRAIKENREIIPCYFCKNPAASLDHCYPYMSDKTLCKNHHKKIVEKERRNPNLSKIEYELRKK